MSNQDLHDALIRHQIALIRFANGLATDALARYDNDRADIREIVLSRVDNIGPFTRKRDRVRLQGLLKRLRKRRGQTWDEIDEFVIGAIRSLARTELNIITDMLDKVLPLKIKPSISGIIGPSISDPWQGRTLRQWLTHGRSSDLANMSARLVAGLVNTLSPSQIARSVVNSPRSRNGLFGLVRSTVTSVTNSVRRRLGQLNPKIFNREIFVAVLDNRTTAICASENGEVYPILSGPQPPLHWNCRSHRAPILNKKDLIGFPVKDDTELRFLEEFSLNNGLSKVATEIDRLPPKLRPAYRKWRKQKLRDIIGRVPGVNSYPEWLRRQPIEVQNEILGKTKAQLFRRGQLEIRNFVNDLREVRTLEDLSRLYREQFIAAGLDPDKF